MHCHNLDLVLCSNGLSFWPWPFLPTTPRPISSSVQTSQWQRLLVSSWPRPDNDVAGIRVSRDGLADIQRSIRASVCAHEYTLCLSLHPTTARCHCLPRLQLLWWEHSYHHGNERASLSRPWPSSLTLSFSTPLRHQCLHRFSVVAVRFQLWLQPVSWHSFTLI